MASMFDPTAPPCAWCGLHICAGCAPPRVTVQWCSGDEATIALAYFTAHEGELTALLWSLVWHARRTYQEAYDACFCHVALQCRMAAPTLTFES